VCQTTAQHPEAALSLRTTTLAASLTLVLLALAAGGGCAQAPDNDARVDAETPIIGGFDAKHPTYDSIGAVVMIKADGSTFPVCTSTLIGPDLIVTAKHCLLMNRPGDKVGFAIGHDGYHPKRIVRLASWDFERGEVKGALMGLGADVAVARLAEPVTDIAPLAIGRLTAADVGKKLLSVGYGLQQSILLDPANPPPPPDMSVLFGTRKGASRTLRAIEGRYWEHLYGTFDAYLAAARTANPKDATSPTFEESIRASWETDRVLPGYDLVFGGPDDESDVCSGDSGGPIVRVEGSTWTVVGVVSGYKWVGPAPNTPFYTCATKSSIYSAFGPKAKHLVDSARACGAVSLRGACEGGQAVRCSRVEEGAPRVLRNDCAALGQTCAATPREPVCAPACRTDEDCAALAPRGTCDAATGTCSWAPSCLDEGEQFSCVLCCLGEESSETCMKACGALAIEPNAERRTQRVVGGRPF
jgi:hypothetical protein